MSDVLDESVAYVLETIRRDGLEAFGRYYSTYRGVVVDHEDPEHLGRIKVKVPALFGDEVLPDWAWPKVALAGPGHGTLVVPRKGSSVWVSFEGGDPKWPVYEGAFWEKGEQPEDADRDEQDKFGVVLPGGSKAYYDEKEKTFRAEIRTKSGTVTISVSEETLTIEDEAGSRIRLSHGQSEAVEIEAASGAKVRVDESGVTMSDPSGDSGNMSAGSTNFSAAASMSLLAPSVTVGQGAFEPLVKFVTFSGWWAGVMAAFLGHQHPIITPRPGELVGPPTTTLPPVVPGLGTVTVKGA